MKGREKATIGIMLTVILCCLLTFSAQAEFSCTCEDGITWVLDDEGTLTISGNGEISMAPDAFSSPDFAQQITQIVIHEGITGISQPWLFGYFYNVRTVSLPHSLTSVGKSAFVIYDLADMPNQITVCYNGLSSEIGAMTIDSSNELLLQTTWQCSDGTAALGSCGADLTWLLEADGILTISGTGKMDSYSSDTEEPWYCVQSYIQAVQIASGVTAIGDFAFYNCRNLTGVSIPESVSTIGEVAFASTGLTHVELPSRITTISFAVFGYCGSLERVTLPAGLESVTFSAFESCESLTDVYYCGTADSRAGITIEENNDALVNADWYYITQGACGDSASWRLEEGVLTISGTGMVTSHPWEASQVRQVVIEDGITGICAAAFYLCRNVTEIIIPESVTFIGAGAFNGCDNLESITLPSGLTGISAYTFVHCVKLSSLTIPAGVTSIGTQAFWSCTALTALVLPEGLQQIGTEAFRNCTELRQVTIPESLSIVG